MNTHMRTGIKEIRSPINVLIPAELKQRAICLGIPFSRTLEEALVARIVDLERAQLGGKPTPEHQPVDQEASNIAP